MKRRVDKLEREIRAEEEPSVILVVWGDKEIPDDKILTLSNGLKMTYAEYKRRYPDRKKKIITWGEDDVMHVTEE